VGADHYQFDVSAFESGVYLIKLETTKGYLLRKMAIE
jgi:hypothetical protein